jgi:hypothetical protein
MARKKKKKSRTPALTIDQLFFLTLLISGFIWDSPAKWDITRMKPMYDSEQTILAILKHPRNMTLDAF